MVRGLLGGLSVLVVGCADPKSITEDEYLKAYPSAYCALQERCYPERFADLFNSDMDACVEQLSEPVVRALEEDSCDFDGEKAATCVDWVESLDCEDWETSEDDTCATRTICGE